MTQVTDLWDERWQQRNVASQAAPSGSSFFKKLSKTPFGNALNDVDSCIMFPVGERELSWKSRKGEHFGIPSHKVLVRMNATGNGGFPLDVVKSTYQLVHNRELFSILQDAITRRVPAEQLAGAHVTDKIAGYGRTCIREYVFPNIKCDVGDPQSDVAFRLIAQNGYGGSALKLIGGAIKFYCANGMLIGEHESVYRKHTRGLVMGDLGVQVGNLLQRFAKSQEEWKRLTTIAVERAATMQMFRDLCSTELLADRLFTRWGVERDNLGSNAWSVYNAMTYYASHNEGEFAVKASSDANEHSIMLQREQRVAAWLQSAAWKSFVGLT